VTRYRTDPSDEDIARARAELDRYAGTNPRTRQAFALGWLQSTLSAIDETDNQDLAHRITAARAIARTHQLED
jgi:hypothetical protein